MGVEVENFSPDTTIAPALDHSLPVEEELQTDAPVVIAETSEPPVAAEATEVAIEATEETLATATVPVGTSSPTRGIPRLEKKESRLPLPGSRLPRKSSIPTLSSDNTSPTRSIPTPKASKLSLVTPKLAASGLRKPSPNASPIRSPGLSPGLKSQSSSGSLRSPLTPTRTGLPLPRSPIGAGTGQRSASVSAATLPKTLQRPSSYSNLLVNKKGSGLPTLTRSPVRESTRSVSVSGASAPARATPQPTQPKRATPTPAKIPASRRVVSTAVTTAPETASAKTTSTVRAPIRVRSFQAPLQSQQSQAPKPLTPRLATVFPKAAPVSTTPKLAAPGSIKVPKRGPRSSIAPVEEPASQGNKHERAMASSQALREQIKAARAARRESNAANIVGNGNGSGNGGDWPQIVIAGTDDKKQDNDDEDAEHPENAEEDEESDYEHPFGAEWSRKKPAKQEEETPKGLIIRPGGILDLTAKNMQEFTEETLGETDTLMVKVLLLQRNSLTMFSPCIKTFRGLYTLDLSCNSLKGEEYLNVEMEFPYLKTLLLHTNYIESLEAVVKYIEAPRLNYLDIHANKLKSFPDDLSKRYGSLTTFVASDNKIETVSVEGLEGIQIVDLMNNSIGQLPPELGLLEGKGLRELRVLGNLFRVPRRNIVERGTEAILEWLRERIPVRVEEIEDDDEKGGEKKEEVKDIKEDGWDVVGRDEEASSD
ncbi:hypothetical protein TWF225_008132 [Orbilia oligospora]|uniref:Leucine-rich repeat-containing protein 40 n=1 Tax=Orbilia oligospora TaxID=2813651 RepID=A0A8H2DZG0_ORBOL|nr:hypothetical protein TWF225_008132 [Orbilia oligospora]KAF3261350.1 hypothetical protein TWF128_003123 [Orbilia oligospora]KAF3268839.1 hypothetical protein TWF217_010135 [Orbilia oligospora]KAF3293283.1 hypothetical protein TWF132_004924 [Orbilia oligospora]TGJ67813.1 hypothetical protein EYR41_006915 [Orbilia oligospora]